MKAWLFAALILPTSCLSARAVAQVTVTLDEPHNPVTMSVPDQPAALQLDLLHLKLLGNQLDGSATRRKAEASDANGWEFTAFLYPVDKSLSAAQLNENTFSDIRKGLNADGIKIEAMRTFAHGDFSLREYIVPEFRGQPVRQKNIFGYTTSGGLGLDFHISKTAYAPADDKFFDALINGVRLLRSYDPDSATEFAYGSVFYLRQEWTRAALHYDRSLQLEKQQRTLSQTRWNVLVDNLGMAYGLSGELPKAKAVFEYGTRENPSYPMFHYNLACVAAESGDLDAALAQLKLAFQFKAYSNPGEGIPDPAKDDSFQRYLNDPKFAKLTKQFCPNSQQTPAGWECP
jgi:tetratricopeptide (TPR) repeat protein